MQNEELVLRFQKNVDNTHNKLVIPKFFVDKWGKSFIMEVNNETGIIVLKAIKKEEK